MENILINGRVYKKESASRKPVYDSGCWKNYLSDDGTEYYMPEDYGDTFIMDDDDIVGDR